MSNKQDRYVEQSVCYVVLKRNTEPGEGWEVWGAAAEWEAR